MCEILKRAINVAKCITKLGFTYNFLKFPVNYYSYQGYH